MSFAVLVDTVRKAFRFPDANEDLHGDSDSTADSRASSSSLNIITFSQRLDNHSSLRSHVRSHAELFAVAQACGWSWFHAIWDCNLRCSKEQRKWSHFVHATGFLVSDFDNLLQSWDCRLGLFFFWNHIGRCSQKGGGTTRTSSVKRRAFGTLFIAVLSKGGPLERPSGCVSRLSSS